MRIARASVAVGLALIATLLLAGGAAGHALPQSSDPAAGASLATPPTAVTIAFGERPDPKLSTIRVLDTAGSLVSTGSTTAVASDPRKLTVALLPLTSGVYTVAWRTVSAVDGHLASGSFAFGVGVAPPTTPQGSAGPATSGSTTAGPSAGAIAGQFLLFLGLLGLLGGAAFGVVVATPASIVGRRLLPLAWIAGAIGSIVVVTVQVADAGVSLGDVPGTSFGAEIVDRAVPLLVAVIAVIVAARRPQDRRALAIVGAGAGAGLVVDVLLSHAAAGGDVPLAVATQAIHVLAVGLWLGGLAGLLLTVGRSADERTARAARRFSVLATVGIATVATTGLLRALQEIGTLDQLVGTDFGRLVVAKTALLIALAMLGAVNHFRNVPIAGRTLLGLRRVGSVELLVGGTVLLLTASLVNLAPPVDVAAAQAPAPSPSPSPLLVDGSDFGTSVRVLLAVSPGTAGFDAFTATVTDFDSGAPVAADGVSLRFVFPARSDVGSSRLDLVPGGPGIFTATGTNLSLAGTWRITVTVAHGTSSVEVPLELSTRASGPAAASPTPTVDVNAVAGLPTIYTVHLSAGRTVQVYLDPGKPGTDDVHVTFFDAAGDELPVPSVTMALGPAGGTLAPLTPRQLEPGHFVATTSVIAGTYSLSISGPAPAGDTLTTQIDIPVAP